jgi:restriction system protein
MLDFRDLIPSISSERKYWLVRTNSGIYYDNFFHEGFIGIGWNQISEEGVTKPTNIPLSDLVKERYPDEQRPKYVANQISTFVHEISKGDVVLIPSQNSSYITFGEVTSDVYVDPNFKEIDDISIDEDLYPLFDLCIYAKRRSVRWIKTIKRENLDPYLYKLLYSQHTVSNATDYAPFIDRTLNSLFIKGNKAHLILHVTKEKDVLAKDLALLITSVLRTIDQINDLTDFNDDELNSDNIEIKLNVQSPGPIEFIGNIPEIALFSLILLLVIGGGIKYDPASNSFEFSLGGLLNQILPFFQNRTEAKRVTLEHERELKRIELEHQRELLKIEAAKEIATSIEKLQIRTPEELSELQQKLIVQAEKMKNQ